MTRAAARETVDGVRFASVGEAERFAALRDRCRAIGVSLETTATSDRLVCVWRRGGRRSVEAFAIRRAKVASGRTGKYNARRVEIDGVWFDSEAEGRRYLELKALQAAGEIVGPIELQPVFEIVSNGQRVGEYRADFRYLCRRRGRRIVEDVKGFKTAVYKLKKKLVEALHGIEIVEVGGKVAKRGRRSGQKTSGVIVRLPQIYTAGRRVSR